MQLYAGTSVQFLRDTTQNQIAEKLRLAFFQHHRYYPSVGEVHSWQNSLRAMGLVIADSGLRDNGVFLEYQLPMSSLRIDCMLTGVGQDAEPHAVIVELKQWERCASTDGEYVVTWVGHGNRELLHPSVQSGNYRHYLADCHTAFHAENPVLLDSCAYLHNYSFAPNDPLLAEKYRRFIVDSPLFSRDDTEKLTGYLQWNLGQGKGGDILANIQNSKFRPSRRLMDEVRGVIKSKSEYVLLDDQLITFDKVATIVRKGWHHARKHVVIVRGGPGTGKSVVAINLLAELLREGFSANYATGSRAFTESLRKAIGGRSLPFFRYFNSYKDAAPNEIDVLIADEAHRIREKSISRFMRKEDYPTKPQVQELLEAAKVSVFLLDDDQTVRPNEIGSTDYIRRSAGTAGALVHEYELAAQFRCMGSDGFVNWVSNTLGVKETANVLWKGDERFEFRIMDSPAELEAFVRDKAAAGNSARLLSGYCFHWSMPRPDGTLPDDVAVGGWKMPWDARPEAKKLAPGIPPATLWPIVPEGINQVGCVYNCQGFEFDYTGVIFGPDLKYNAKAAAWEADRKASHDPTVKRGNLSFLRHVQNTYRVLLSRAIKGCAVYFMDEGTRNFFRSRMA